MNTQRVSTMTADEIAAIVRQAVREEFDRVGLRVDDTSHQDEARRDFMFLRALRKSTYGAASKVGLAITLSIASGIIWLLITGLNGWRGGSP